MPNVLIQPYVLGIQAAVTIPLFDPRRTRENRVRFRRDTIPELARANSIAIPVDRWPARAWVLVRRADYARLSQYATNLQLQFDDLSGAAPLTFQNLAIVQARCVSRGVLADSDALYLVELTDGRGILWNQWFQFGTTSAYNVRSPAYPEQFYSPSMNAGVAYTWDTMIRNLWEQMGAFLGPYPGLPSTPTGTPENFWLPGVSAWEALLNALELLGFNLACDLTSATPYSIVTAGGADATFATLQAYYAARLEDDWEYIDAGSGRVPGSVTVLFHRRNQFYGTEETIRRDSSQWAMTMAYPVTVAAPAQFTGAVGSHYLWDDFSVRYDMDGTPLSADVTTANAIAAQRVTNYYANIYRSTVGFLNQVYTGLVPFTPGAQLDGVCFYMGQHTVQNKVRFGFLTEIRRGQLPPWPELAVQTDY